MAISFSRWRPAGLLAGLLALALLVTACGGGGSSSGSTSGSGSASRSSSGSSSAPAVTVSMKNFRFNPAEIRVKAGQKVVFKNDDVIQHNVIQATPDKGLTGPFGFESPRLAAGETWEYVFAKPGEYPILCNVDGHHLAGMTAKVIVE